MGKHADAGIAHAAKSAARDFGLVGRLAARGIRFIGTTWLPGPGGDYTNGERGYILNDNGKQIIRAYGDVLLL
jgi:hypothetical protein